MNVYELTEHRDYDCVAPSIQCRADREGAEVFEIRSGNALVRVMAHSEADAKTTAESYAERWVKE